MKFLNYSEKIERYNHSEINPPQLVRKMDFFLIGVITLSYSGILSFLPMGTFSHSWVERVFDIVVISYVCLRPKSFDSAQPILLPTVWMLFYFIFGYLLGENSDLVTNSMGKGILVYLPLLFFTGLAIRNQNQWARMAAVCQFVALGACAVILTQAVFPSVLDYTMASVESYSSSGIAFEHNRLSALWMNPNDAALCFSVTYVLSLWCRPEWLAWAGRLASVVGILFTVSRTGWLLILIFTIAYMAISYLQGRLPSIRIAKRLAIGAIGVVICAFLLSNSSQSDKVIDYFRTRNIGERFSASDVTQSYDNRSSLADYWLNKAVDGPWYGSGLSSFEYGDNYVAGGCHNQFIMIYGEVGLAGFVTYLLLLGIGIHRACTTPLAKRDRLILLLLWVMILFCHFKGHAMFDARHYYVIWGLLFTAPYVLKLAPPIVSGYPNIMPNER